MGPPPPPPPPPPHFSSATLPSGGWKTTNASRCDNNSLPKTSNKTRPAVDSEVLQHAAARLRKTGYYEQIRGDVPNLSDGRVAGSDQRLSDGDRSYGTQFNKLGSNSPREQIHATSPYTRHTDSFGDVRGCANSSLKDQDVSTPSVQFSTTTLPRNTYNNPPYKSIMKNTLEQRDINANKHPQPYSNLGQECKNVSSVNSYTSAHNENLPYAPVYSAVQTERSYSPNPYGTQCSPSNRTFNTHTSTTKVIHQYEDTAHPSVNYSEWHDSYNPASSYVLNPRARIRDYATQNYVQTDPMQDTNYVSTTGRKKQTDSFTHDFVASIRNQGLTPSQREANRYQSSINRTDEIPFDARRIREKSYRGDVVDRLVDDMQTEMYMNRTSRTSNFSRNICVACQSEITGDNPGCTALNQVFHVSCFKCKTCGCKLAGSSFYNIDDAPTCDACYQNTLEKCNKCNKPISDRLLRACGGTFHVECFVCTSCHGTLDGIPFTTDPNNDVFCVSCYQDKFAPRCAVCHKGIVPVEGEKESVRVVAMEKSFHPGCYRCEDCGLQLSSKIEGAGCYPLNSHLYCKTCNSNRLRMQDTV